MGGFEYFQSRGYSFLVSIKSHLCMILKKAIVYDFSKKLLSLNSLEMNKLTMNGKIQNFRPDVTFPRSLQKKTRHSCSLNWQQTRMTHVFCRNKLPSWKQSGPKSPKYIFTERPAISLTYSSFGFKLGFFLLIIPNILASLRQQSPEFDIWESFA